MIIQFSPVRMDGEVVITVEGDKVTIDSEFLAVESFDFQPLPDGGILPADAIESAWITGPVERKDGQVHVTIRLPIGPRPSLAARFPAPKLITEDGIVELPR